jgi:hypothetical protein|tara:strand:- start:181 stop:291 length:111 start_codon:yes stop_codon:yes gene_type:complete
MNEEGNIFIKRHMMKNVDLLTKEASKTISCTEEEGV